MSNVVVTGGTGFIGRHLVRRLVALGHDVRCLVRSKSALSTLADLPVEFRQADLLDAEELSRVVTDCDVVYHVAGVTVALNMDNLYATNVVGTHRLAEACARQPNPPVLVYVSSLAAAGTHAPAPTSRALAGSAPASPVAARRPRPVSEYGRSKRGGELAVARWSSELPASIVRPGIVFGEENRETFPVFAGIHYWNTHLVPTWTDRRVAMIHQADLVELLLRVAERGRRVSGTGTERGVYDAADEHCPTYAGWGRLIARSVGQPGPLILRVPEPALWLAAAANELRLRIHGGQDHFLLDKIREATAGHWSCHGEVARLELGMAPPPPLGQRLAETMQWYRREGWLRAVKRPALSIRRQPRRERVRREASA